MRVLHRSVVNPEREITGLLPVGVGTFMLRRTCLYRGTKWCVASGRRRQRSRPRGGGVRSRSGKVLLAGPDEPGGSGGGLVPVFAQVRDATLGALGLARHTAVAPVQNQPMVR